MPCWRGNGCNRVTGETNALYGKHRLILDLATIPAVFSNVIRREYDNVIWYSRSIYPQDSRMRIGRAENTGMQHPLEFNILRITDSPNHSWITHSQSSP